MPSRFATFNFTEEIRQTGDAGNFISRSEFDDLKQSIDAQFKQLADIIKGGASVAPAVIKQSANVSAET